ncbi:MAG: biotin-dependent carboxyltransferase family protein [Burkholderiaceae bacterium]|nr:biotin-dependent carboxyltransferase family protein [Burkholderiaceae bacterium]
MSMVILKPGMLSTFQDLGRFGHQHLGVSVAGAMDQRAHRLANMLVGNDPALATLEITLTGPTLRFTKPCCLALCGADLSANLNGQPLILNRPIVVRAKDELSFGVRQHGTRAYLAVHGGFALTPVLGSTSTYLRSAMGGWHGRALRRDDEIPLLRPLKDKGLEDLAMDLWSLKIYLPAALAESRQAFVRLIKGQQWDEFTPESCAALLTEPYRVSPDSERMGYRLQGAPLLMTTPRQMISEGTTFGTIQVPAGGQPIILMADRQTTGGYPKMAYVASVDLPRLAQMGPGDMVSFKAISLEQAQTLDVARAQAFATLADALQPVRNLLLNH